MTISRNVMIGATLLMGCLSAAVSGCSASSTVDPKPTIETQVVVVAPTAPKPTALPSPSPEPTTAPAQIPLAKANDSTRADALELAKHQRPSDSLFDTLMTPFVNEALKRRAELAKSDPEYSKRIDKELNEGRVNFLLFGYGETHEPPLTEKAIIGSQTIISYDVQNRVANIVSLTHDIRAPEIERELTKRNKKSPAVRIDQAYNVGGFKLMRQLLEDATGLSIDFQVTFKDVVMQRLIDNVFEGVDIDVPMAFDVQPFYLDGIKYPKGNFPRGKQRLNGRQVIQFIKTVPISDAAYDKSLEHNQRKYLVFTALLESIDNNYKDRDFWLRGSAFVTKELVTGAITYDFDPIPLMVNNVGSTVASIGKFVGKDRSDGVQPPQIKKSIYVVDPAHGDGGVQWVNANAVVNPITKKDIDAGVYASLDMEVPINSNPYGDLVTGYWTSVRTLVKQTLTSASP